MNAPLQCFHSLETKQTVTIHIWLGLLWLFKIAFMYICHHWNIVCSFFQHVHFWITISKKPLTFMGPVTMIKQLHLVKTRINTNVNSDRLYSLLVCGLTLHTQHLSWECNAKYYSVKCKLIFYNYYKATGDMYCTVYVINSINSYNVF